MAELSNASDRYMHALKLVLQRARARTGFLYLLQRRGAVARRCQQHERQLRVFQQVRAVEPGTLELDAGERVPEVFAASKNSRVFRVIFGRIVLEEHTAGSRIRPDEHSNQTPQAVHRQLDEQAVRCRATRLHQANRRGLALSRARQLAVVHELQRG
jgi:hypothetical protein